MRQYKIKTLDSNCQGFINILYFIFPSSRKAVVPKQRTPIVQRHRQHVNDLLPTTSKKGILTNLAHINSFRPFLTIFYFKTYFISLGNFIN